MKYLVTLLIKGASRQDGMFFKVIIGVFVFPMLVSCSSSPLKTHMTYVYSDTNRAGHEVAPASINSQLNTSTISDKNFPVFGVKEEIDQPYHISGKVFVEGAYERGNTKEKRKSALIDSAKRMGANAIIGYRDAHPTATALAVKIVEQNKVTRPAQEDFIVAVLPVQTGVKSSDEEKELGDKIRALLGGNLDGLGYYAITPKDLSFRGNIADLKAMPQESLENLGDSKAGLVMLVEVLDADSGFYVLISTAEVILKGYLFSKSSRSIIWENEAKGDATTGWMLSMAGVHHSFAMGQAVARMLRTLPPIHEGLSEYVGATSRE